MSNEDINVSLKVRELDIASPHTHNGDDDPDTWHLVADATWTRGALSIWVFRSRGVNSMCFECGLDGARWSAYIERINQGEAPQSLAAEIISELWGEMNEPSKETHAWGTAPPGTRDYFRDELAKWIERNRAAR